MQAITLTILNRGNQALPPAGATDLVRLTDLQSAISGTMPLGQTFVAADILDFETALRAWALANGVVLSGTGAVALLTNGGLQYVGGGLAVNSGVVSLVGHTHYSAAVLDFTPAVLAVLAANGVALSGTGAVSLLTNGGLIAVGGGLAVNSGVVSLRGHTHVATDITDLQAALGAWAAANGVTLSGTGAVPLAVGGGLVYANGLSVNSGVVSLVGHTHHSTDVVDLPAAVWALLQTNFASSPSVVMSGTGPLMFNVALAPGGGLTVSAAGLGVALGTAHTQAAYGDHTHSQLHNPVTLGTANSISGTLLGQQISFEVVPVLAGGLLVTPSGLQVDWSVVQRAGASAPAFVLGMASTPTLNLGYTGSVLSGTVPLDPAPGGGTGGLIVAGANGLYVALGTTANTAAAGNHIHSAATTTTDGFMAASDKAILLALAAAPAPSGVAPASTPTLQLGMSAGNVISGTVLFNTNPLFGYGALGANVNGLYVVLGTAANNAALGNHLHDTRYLQLAGGAMSGTLTLSGLPTTSLMAATKGYVDAAVLNYLPLTGGVLSGTLTINGSLAINGGTLTLGAAPTLTMQAATKGYVDTATGLCLPLAGGTLTGALVLAGLPVTAGQAATKGYVDTATGLCLPLAGGTITGALVLGSTLTLAADPAAALQAATKQYVDAAVLAVLATQTSIANAANASSDPPTAADFNALVAIVNQILASLHYLGQPVG